MDGLSSFAVYTPMHTPPNLTAHLAMPSEIPILFSESYGYLLLALGVILGYVSVCILPAGGVCCITLVPTCCVMVIRSDGMQRILGKTGAHTVVLYKCGCQFMRADTGRSTRTDLVPQGVTWLHYRSARLLCARKGGYEASLIGWIGRVNMVGITAEPLQNLVLLTPSLPPAW